MWVRLGLGLGLGLARQGNEIQLGGEEEGRGGGGGGREGGGSFISRSMFSGPTFFNLCWINNMGLCTQRSSNYPPRLCFLRGNELGMAFAVDRRNAPAQ